MRILAFDPALSNLGIAKFDYDPVADKLSLLRLRLVQTEASKEKITRKSSDDLERAKMLAVALKEEAEDCDIAIAEVPIGSQSARAMASYGMSVMLIAMCPLPVVPVTPKEAKMASVGVATATKHEMIEWAMRQYPDGSWVVKPYKGKPKPVDDMEHLADACAIARAGIKTDQFKLAKSFYAMKNQSLVN